MKKNLIIIIILLLTAASLSSCKDDVTLNGLSNQAELVVYCFPTIADTTYISVSRSLPVSKYSEGMKLSSVDSATIIYNVNGNPQSVHNCGNGFYYVLAKQNAGDQISVMVSADGLPTANGTTVIPDTVPIGKAEVKTVNLYDNDYENTYEYYQIAADFTDPAGSRDYYIPRVRVRNILMKQDRDDSSYYHSEHNSPEKVLSGEEAAAFDTLYYYPKVYAQSEPLITSLTNIDDDFGFDDERYGDLCIFNDASINGLSYRLHLNILSHMPSFQNTVSSGICIELLHVTPELYKFLNSVNSVNNSDFAKHGLSQISPTASNVRGGFGVIAGWNVSRTNYVDIQLNN